MLKLVPISGKNLYDKDKWIIIKPEDEQEGLTSFRKNVYSRAREVGKRPCSEKNTLRKAKKTKK